MVQSNSTTLHGRCILVPERGMCKKPQWHYARTALADDDDLYWEMDTTKPPSPKCKRAQADEESIDDSILTVKMAMSVKKPPKSALKGKSSTTDRTSNQTRFGQDAQMVASQTTIISQLTDMVSEVKQENKTLMSCFDKLTEQIEALLANQTLSSNSQCPAGGHDHESGSKKWRLSAAGHWVRSTQASIVHPFQNHPQNLLSTFGWGGLSPEKVRSVG